MAQGAFSRRFPHARLFLLVAILAGLSLTVWSFLKVPTQTQNHAAGYTCGAQNKSPRCPAGLQCSFTAGNTNFGGTCITTSLSTPTGLSDSVQRCDPDNEVSLNWRAVNGAEGYFLFIKNVTAINYPKTPITLSKSVVGNYPHYDFDQKNLGGGRLNWYVEAETSSDTSHKSITLTTPYRQNVDCH